MIPAGLRHPVLLARTVRHLDGSQVIHRARLRSKRAVTARLPSPDQTRSGQPLSVPGWPSAYTPLDGRLVAGYPNAEVNAAGSFRFLNDERAIGDDWQPADAPQLWRYHLNYFEWAWAFAAHPDRAWARDAFIRLWKSWRTSAPPWRGDSWSPYVTSVRAWALCGVYRRLVRGSGIEGEVARHLRMTADYLRTNLELDVGGNHLIKNLKALTGLGVFLADERLVRLARRHLVRQLPVQVLADGGHFERSPSYHCQVLGDLIDVSELLATNGSPAIEAVDGAVAAMRRWLGAMVLPDGDVPLINDSVLLGPDRVGLLSPEPPEEQPVTVLAPSGFVVARPGGGVHLVADVGPPGAPQLPAHAHAGCLGFELAAGTRRLIVDSGTSTYAPGNRRRFERSTEAHSTVEIDGTDQSEMWGIFRVARRAEPVLEVARDDGGVIEIAASHNGYRRLAGAPRHRRVWRVGRASVEIEDEVSGDGEHRVVSRLYLAEPERRLRVTTTGPVGTTTETAAVRLARAFGVTYPGAVVTSSFTGALPVRFHTRVQLDPPVEQAVDVVIGLPTRRTAGADARPVVAG